MFCCILLPFVVLLKLLFEAVLRVYWVHTYNKGRFRMSRTSANQNPSRENENNFGDFDNFHNDENSSDVRCNACDKLLAKKLDGDGEISIKCSRKTSEGRCENFTNVRAHVYPPSGLSIRTDEEMVEEHLKKAKLFGCKQCGIEPQKPITSREAAMLYRNVPHTLDTKGNDYVLPVFKQDKPDMLSGMKVLIICADGPELPELYVPMDYLRDRGAQVDLAGQDWIFQYRDPAGHIVVAQWLDDSRMVKADLRFSDVKVAEYDAVFVPGGAWNPDMLRGDDQALRIIREAHKLGKLVVSLCHGPQVIISAAYDAPEGQENFPCQGVHLTGTTSIRRDLKNAGFIVHSDDAVVFDEGANLLTARDPNDLGPLCEKLGQLLMQALR